MTAPTGLPARPKPTTVARPPTSAALRRLSGLPHALERLRAPVSRRQLCDVTANALHRDLGFDHVAVLCATDGVARPISFAGPHAAPPSASMPVAILDLDAELVVFRRRRAALVPAGLGLTIVPADADCILAPVCLDGQVVGLLQATDTTVVELGPPDVDLVAAFAVAVGRALERTSTEQRAHRQSLAVREAAAALEALADGTLRPARGLLRGLTATSGDPDDDNLPLTAQRLQMLLTARELEVIDLLAAGSSNAEIASHLVISAGTVKSHVKNLLRKLHAANRAQAVAIYLRLARP